MTNEEYKYRIEHDNYLIKRERISEVEKNIYLDEVDFICPLCGKRLYDKRNGKKRTPLFEIAHIYPNSPTKNQYETLDDLERLGENCESFENKIALCLNCHKKQDYNTTKEKYLKLLERKKQLMENLNKNEMLNEMIIEDEIKKIITKIEGLDFDSKIDLKYEPVEVKKKIPNENGIFFNKVYNNIICYYLKVNNEFKVNKNYNISYESICLNIRNVYVKMSSLYKNQEDLFNKLVDWLSKKTQTSSICACEIIISYFIQNCEVFDEITK